MIKESTLLVAMIIGYTEYNVEITGGGIFRNEALEWVLDEATKWAWRTGPVIML